MNKYLIRTPLFSIQDLLEFYNKDDVQSKEYIFQFFRSNIYFRESIYLYSKDLFYSALIFNEHGIKDFKKYNSVAESLIKYYLRMSYRATPFGLSAGLAVGEFELSGWNKPIDFNKRSIKIDSRVLIRMLNELNLDNGLREVLTYYTNNTLFEKEKNYRFIERHTKDIRFDFSISKVEKTEILENVINLGLEGITLSEFNKFLSDQDLDDITIKSFFFEVIDTQMLISELNFDVLDENFLLTLISILQNLRNKTDSQILNSTLKLLKSVVELKEKLENLPLESREGLNTIIEIDELLKPYNNFGKSTIQVDLIGHANSILPLNIKSQVEKKLDFFLAIDEFFNAANTELNDFKIEFIAQYNNKSVPLLEVLDPDIGIGFPVRRTVNSNSDLLKNFKIDRKNDNQNKFSGWDAILMNKYEKCLRNNEECIYLNKDDFGLSEKSNSNNIKLNDSLLFTGQVVKTENDEKIFVNSIKVGAAHFIAGRFGYQSSAIQKFCKNIVKHEQELKNHNSVYADLNHLSQPHLGNISSRNNYYNKSIPIYNLSGKNNEKEIHLRELSICVINEKIILYSVKTGEKVIPRIGCAQNTSYLTNPLYKFLGAMSNSFFLQTWNWGVFNNNKFLPRVEFDGFILSKKRWLLLKNDLSNFSRESLNKVISSLGIDQYVTISLGGDNFIPLNLYQDISLSIIEKEIKKKGSLILEETLFINENTQFSNLEFSKTHEICIPFLVKEKSKPKAIEISNFYTNKNLVEEMSHFKNKLFSFKDILYFKIYIKPGSNVDQLFLPKLKKLVRQLEHRGILNKFFFIKYLDPEYHLRLRFFVSNQYFEIVSKSLYEIFENEINNNEIRKIELDTYERETVRYGGNMGMVFSEDLFYHDSNTVLNILTYYLNQANFETSKWEIGMQGVHFIFNDFSVKLDDRLVKLEEMRDYYLTRINNTKRLKRQIRDFYRLNRKKIEKRLIFDLENLDFFENEFIKRSNLTKGILSNMISNGIEYDVKNYIHMFLNRFYEFNQNIIELIIYDLLIIYYKSLKGKLKLSPNVNFINLC